VPGIDDQSQEVRQQVRCCFLIYAAIPEFRDVALSLAFKIRTVGKKQLMNDLEEHGLV
jgi:hypothetical protein